MCLDVRIQPGFAPGNAALVASGRAQMGSGGSMGELMNNNLRGGGDLVAVVDYGKTAIEELVIPAKSRIERVQDLRGATIGVKGDIPYSIQTMLGVNGVPRSSLKEVLLEGFDPVAQLKLGLDALPVYKSNEPRQLDAVGIKYRTFDPLDFKIPSSFGIQFTSRAFLQAHRSAVQDFVRASFKGFQFGLGHSRAAVQDAIDLVKAADGTLTLDGELYRWKTESAIVLRSTPQGEPYGLIDVARVKAEAQAETRVGVFDKVPDFATMIDTSLARSVWHGTTLKWPS
jgi:NitT/TauT family transport system substrate-binding protein